MTTMIATAIAAAATTPTPTRVPPPSFTFGEARFYPVGQGAIDLAAGDFNGDTLADLIVLNGDSESLAQLNNDGLGRFTRYGADRKLPSDTFPSRVLTFRKNDDLIADFAVIRDPTESEDPEGSFLSRATIFRSRGANVFLTSTATAGSGAGFLREVASTTNPKLDDLVIVNNYDDNFSWLANQLGDSNLLAKQDFTTVDLPLAIAAGDFNNDGRPDLAAIGEGGAPTAQVAIHLNSGATPRFSSCPTCPTVDTGIIPVAIEAADLNGDGNTDLVVVDEADLTVSSYLGNGDGTFGPAKVVDLDGDPAALGKADFNGDAVPDVVLTLPDDDKIVVLLGYGDGAFYQGLPAITLDNSPEALAVADFNGDGLMDVAATVMEEEVVVLLNGVSPPAYTPTPTHTSTLTPVPTRTRTPTRTATPSRTGTATHTPSRTPTPTRTGTFTPTATLAQTFCPGDCNGNGAVTAGELTKVIAIVNSCQPCSGGSGGSAAGCPAIPGTDKQCGNADYNRNGCISAGELTRVISGMITYVPSGCPP